MAVRRIHGDLPVYITPLLGDFDESPTFKDQELRCISIPLPSIRSPARDQDVVALFERQNSEKRLKAARAVVNEIELVAIAIGKKTRAGLGRLDHAHLHV